jgi:hypothetical protein
VCSPFRALSMTYQATMSASARAGMFLAWNFLVYIMGSGAHKEVACSMRYMAACQCSRGRQRRAAALRSYRRSTVSTMPTIATR